MMKLNINPDAALLRQFSWVSLFAFGLIGLLLRWQFGLPWNWVYGLAAFGAAVFLLGVPLRNQLVPRVVFVVLSVASWPIGQVVSWVLLVLIYYGLFTFVALVFRLIGRDAMRRRLDPAVDSYWDDRGPEREPASYFKLY